MNGKKRKKKEGKLNERVNEMVSKRKTRKRVLQVSKIVKSKNKQNKLCHGSDRGKEKENLCKVKMCGSRIMNIKGKFNRKMFKFHKSACS